MRTVPSGVSDGGRKLWLKAYNTERTPRKVHHKSYIVINRCCWWQTVLLIMTNYFHYMHVNNWLYLYPTLTPAEFPSFCYMTCEMNCVEVLWIAVVIMKRCFNSIATKWIFDLKFLQWYGHTWTAASCMICIRFNMTTPQISIHGPPVQVVFAQEPNILCSKISNTFPLR